jgi:anti-sigma factor RsiW
MNEDFAELDGVLSRYLEGELSAEEFAALESRLLADDAFADHFSRWCLMHRQVTELLAEDQLHALMDQFSAGVPRLPKQIFTRAAQAQQKSRNESAAGRRRTWFTGAMAASIAVVGAALAWWLAARDANVAEQPQGAAAVAAADGPANSNDSDAHIIATVTRLVDAAWQPGSVELQRGQQLEAGSRVALKTGMAKVTFECGAEVVLEGPCDFVIESAMIGVLNSGKITADVPRRAFAFAIRAPGADFVDLGTSFGVAVGDKGRTELHVFDGEVLCSQRVNDDQIRKAQLHVTSQNAMEFNADGGDASHIAMNQQQFSQLIALRRTADVPPQRWAQNRLALWLSADAAVTTDDQHRVVSWQDIVYADNQSAEDAMQVDEKARPKLVPDAINGHPVVRFDGNSDFLLTTPIETTDDQTVMFVCQFAPSAFDKGRRWGGQIINYDGPPSRYLSNTLEPGVLQIGEPLLEDEFKPSLLTGQVFAGFIGSAVVEAGRVDAEPVGANTPVVVSYVYDYEYGGGESRLAINGRTHGESRAFAPQHITSRKIIGRHAWMDLYFHGDLAEMLIFNKALSPEELAETTKYLADKYSIQVASDVRAEPAVAD